MKRMNNESSPVGDRLDALFGQYREACPDREAGSDFMPQLWLRIEAQRRVPAFLFRRWAEVCVIATAAAALFISALVIPRFQSAPAYQAHYVDVLAYADSSQDALVLLETTALDGDFR